MDKKFVKAYKDLDNFKEHRGGAFLEFQSLLRNFDKRKVIKKPKGK